ncbi:MAG: type II toxin-antitoxin system HicA family toxin [Verrucomicrobia bacterium]|nr:type II toxin-antitoxin system HicA family toxin [Verrucomicrobiota bacterium]MCX6906984.1 type II toxin-antitoxin system HicA family toxin [Verrucomicrobiota bacterium]
MPRRLSSTEIIRVLQQHGFGFVSQKGSHCKYKNPTGRIAIVPHPKKEIPAGTTRSIIRQSGLTPVDFGF